MPNYAAEKHSIYAVTFYDHHSWQAPTTANARDLSDATIITVFGRIINETPISIMVENAHVDRSHPENAGEGSVQATGWNIIKGAIVAKTKIGIWEHPTDEILYPK